MHPGNPSLPPPPPVRIRTAATPNFAARCRSTFREFMIPSWNCILPGVRYILPIRRWVFPPFGGRFHQVGASIRSGSGFFHQEGVSFRSRGASFREGSTADTEGCTADMEGCTAAPEGSAKVPILPDKRKALSEAAARPPPLMFAVTRLGGSQLQQRHRINPRWCFS